MHNAVSADKVKSAAYAAGNRVKASIQNCPNGPALQGNPVVTVSKSGSMSSAASYQGKLRWSANWTDEYMYDNTKRCIEQAIMNSMDAQVRPYIKSIKAGRG
jgi:hypothetical protein